MKLLGSDFVSKHKVKQQTQNGEAMQCKPNTIYIKVLYENIDQTLMNSLHSLVNFEIGGLYCLVIQQSIYLVSLNTHVTPSLWCISSCNLSRSFWSIFIYNKLLCMNLWSLQYPICACFSRGRECEVHVDYNYHYPTTWCLLPFPMKYNNDH